MSEQDSTEDTPVRHPVDADAVPAAPATAEAEPEVEHSFVADGVDYKLDPNWVLASRLSGGIVAVIISGVNLIGLLIAVFASRWRGPSVLLAFGGWLLLSAALACWTQVGPALRYKRRRYRLDEMGLRIRRGLVWHAEISVPYSRIQHTDVSRGPVERSFGLSTLIVHTAGTENASVSLDGLPAARAYRIRDLLLARVESDDAV
jgi:membrane protein YdbS with pleckstrin-like domain